MALSKKGLRKIVVDGKRYVWKVRCQPTYSQGLGTSLIFAVEKADVKGSILVVDTQMARPDNWLNEPSIVITPLHVAKIIRQALGKGWNPNQKAPPFELVIKDSEQALLK